MDKGPSHSPRTEESNKRMARAFGMEVSKTIQETLHRFQEGPPSGKAFDDLPSSEQLEHLEEMETASRLVFSRKRAARQEAREAAIAEHQKTMSAVKRAMDIAFRSELNMNAAFKRKREIREAHEQAVWYSRQPSLCERV